jgi:hypothetical protein
VCRSAGSHERRAELARPYPRMSDFPRGRNGCSWPNSIVFISRCLWHCVTLLFCGSEGGCGRGFQHQATAVAADKLKRRISAHRSRRAGRGSPRPVGFPEPELPSGCGVLCARTNLWTASKFSPVTKPHRSSNIAILPLTPSSPPHPSVSNPVTPPGALSSVRFLDPLAAAGARVNRWRLAVLRSRLFRQPFDSCSRPPVLHLLTQH